MTQLVEARNKLQAKSNELAKLIEEGGGYDALDLDKIKSLGELSRPDKMARIKSMNDEIAAIGKECDDYAEVAKAAAEAKARKGDGGFTHETGDSGKKDAKPVDPIKAFVNSAEFKGRREFMADTIGIKTLFERGAGWEPEVVRSGRVVDFATRPAPFVSQFFPSIPTTQGGYKYMEETTYASSNVVEKAEAAAFGEAALALTERSVPVEKIPAWIPVTDEQLEDVPGAEAYLRNRLGLMLAQRLDYQALRGDGTPPNLRGTMNVGSIQSQAIGSDSIPDAVYKLFTSIRSVGFAEPNVVFLHPSVWQDVRLLKTADGMYIWGHPSDAGVERLWGIQVVPTTVLPTTHIVTGDYANYSLLVERSGIQFQVTNSHSTHFIEGKQAVRATVRVAVVHLRPAAFGQVTGL